MQIVAASVIVADLAPDQVTNKGNQQAFLKFLSQAVLAIQADDIAEAIDKLQKAISRSDGCTLNEPPAADGAGPGQDWIIDCDAQIEVYGLLNAALAALNTLTP